MPDYVSQLMRYRTLASLVSRSLRTSDPRTNQKIARLGQRFCGLAARAAMDKLGILYNGLRREVLMLAVFAPFKPYTAVCTAHRRRPDRAGMSSV